MEVNSVQQSYIAPPLKMCSSPMLENIGPKTIATHQTKSLTKERWLVGCLLLVKCIHVVLSHDITIPTLPTYMWVYCRDQVTVDYFPNGCGKCEIITILF